MKKKIRRKRTQKTPKRYDFSKAVRGKYYKQYMKGNNIVIISKDLAKIFPDSAAVNKALRTYIKLSKRAA